MRPFLYMLIAILACSCTLHQDKRACKPDFFSTPSSALTADSILSLEPKMEAVNNIDRCGYEMTIKSLCSFRIDPLVYPIQTFKGFIFHDELNRVINYRPINSASETYKFLDFSVHVGQSYTTRWVNEYAHTAKNEIRIEDRPCKVTLDQKFTVLDANSRIDTIYVHRFSGLKLVRTDFDDDELVLLSSIRQGIVGLYHEFRGEEYEEIFCFKGNVYRERMDSSKVIFLKHLRLE